MIPSIGRIVEYTLTSQDADQINRRREDAKNNKAVGQTGFMLHSGNAVRADNTYPLVITRVWGDQENSVVNGQVLLDGNDTFWVTSVKQGGGQRQFREFPRT